MASQRIDRKAAAPDREPPAIKSACHRCDDLIHAVNALHAAILQLPEILKGLGQVAESRYSTGMQTAEDMLDEQSMAQRLGISRRVLAEHRKNGKLRGCWVKNGRQIRWHVHETMDVWKRGIA